MCAVLLGIAVRTNVCKKVKDTDLGLRKKCNWDVVTQRRTLQATLTL